MATLYGAENKCIYAVGGAWGGGVGGEGGGRSCMTRTGSGAGEKSDGG